MSKEPSRIEVLHMMPLKHQSDGRGIAIWLSLWGLLLFGFERYVGLTGWLMWTFRIAGLICLLIGTMGIGVCFDGKKEP